MFRRIFSILIVVLMLGGVLLTAVSSSNSAQEEEIDNLIAAESLIKTLHIMVVGFENKVVNIEKLTTDVLPVVLYKIAETPELLRLWVDMERKVLAQEEVMVGLREWKKRERELKWPPWPWPFPWPWPDCYPVLWAFDAGIIIVDLRTKFDLSPGRMRELIAGDPRVAGIIIVDGLRLTAEWIVDEKHSAYLERLSKNVVPILISRLAESPGLRERSIPMMKELGRYSEQKPVTEAIAKLKESLMENGLTEEQALMSSWGAFSRGVRLALYIAPLLGK